MRRYTLEDVVFAAQAACMLEASVDKPGNVGPLHSFADTTYLDFLIAAAAIGRAVREAVELGVRQGRGRGVGRLIKTAVADAKRRGCKGNVNLGISMLLIPLSTACGLCIREGSFKSSALRDSTIRVLSSSTPQDAVQLYEAIVISDAEVGRSRVFDVKEPGSKARLLEKGLNLYDVLSISTWDAVARELVSGMEVTFTIGYPAVKQGFLETSDIGQAVLRCFFEILSKVPDTLIERKAGREAAEEVSREAGRILGKGLGREDVARFDAWLRRDGNRYNPGATADLTASSLMVALLNRVFAEQV